MPRACPCACAPRAYWSCLPGQEILGPEAREHHDGKRIDIRGELANLLLERIASDRRPSVAMMNLVEQLLAPDAVLVYAFVLLDKVKAERYPSAAMIHR